MSRASNQGMRFSKVTVVCLLAGLSPAMGLRVVHPPSRNQQAAIDGVLKERGQVIDEKLSQMLAKTAKIAKSSKGKARKIIAMRDALDMKNLKIPDIIKHEASEGSWTIAAEITKSRDHDTLGLAETTDNGLHHSTVYSLSRESRDPPKAEHRFIKKVMGSLSIQAVSRTAQTGARVNMSYNKNLPYFAFDDTIRALAARKIENEFDRKATALARRLLDMFHSAIHKSEAKDVEENYSSSEVARWEQIPESHAEELLWRGVAILRGAMTKANRELDGK